MFSLARQQFEPFGDFGGESLHVITQLTDAMIHVVPPFTRGLQRSLEFLHLLTNVSFEFAKDGSTAFGRFASPASFTQLHLFQTFLFVTLAKFHLLHAVPFATLHLFYVLTLAALAQLHLFHVLHLFHAFPFTKFAQLHLFHTLPFATFVPFDALAVLVRMLVVVIARRVETLGQSLGDIVHAARVQVVDRDPQMFQRRHRVVAFRARRMRAVVVMLALLGMMSLPLEMVAFAFHPLAIHLHPLAIHLHPHAIHLHPLAIHLHSLAFEFQAAFVEFELAVLQFQLNFVPTSGRFQFPCLQFQHARLQRLVSRRDLDPGSRTLQGRPLIGGNWSVLLGDGHGAETGGEQHDQSGKTILANPVHRDPQRHRMVRP